MKLDRVFLSLQSSVLHSPPAAQLPLNSVTARKEIKWEKNSNKFNTPPSFPALQQPGRHPTSTLQQGISTAQLSSERTRQSWCLLCRHLSWDALTHPLEGDFSLSLSLFLPSVTHLSAQFPPHMHKEGREASHGTADAKADTSLTPHMKPWPAASQMERWNAER